MHDLKLISKTKDFSSDYNILRNNLRAYNASQVDDYNLDELLLLYKTSDGEIVAGLYAYHSVGGFQIDMLWVEDKYRNHGLGGNLLDHAEKYARELDALYIRINTASFQAPEFYLKHDYEVLNKLPLRTNNKLEHHSYYLVKWL